MSKKLIRLFGIVGQLSPNSNISIKALSKEFRVSENVIHNDIGTLLDSKMGILYDGETLSISKTGYRRVCSWIM